MDLPVTWAGPKDSGKVHSTGPESKADEFKPNVQAVVGYRSAITSGLPRFVDLYPTTDYHLARTVSVLNGV